jgi:hypothetical protein
MSFKQFRELHNLTKQQVYRGSGLKRSVLATIENNTGRAMTHNVVLLLRYYRTIDPSIDASMFTY